MINFPAAKMVDTVGQEQVTFEIPPDMRNDFWAIVAKSKTNQWNVKISKPKIPRTTGPESQCNCGNGYCQQIAKSTGNSFEAVKQYTKTEAIGRGYSFETLPNGAVLPISEANASTEDDYHWIKTIKQLADELGIKLKGDDGE